MACARTYCTGSFSFLSESEAMRITNDVLIQRAFVMRTIDDEEEQILSEIDAWQRTEEAAHAEEAFFPGQASRNRGHWAEDT